MRRVIAVSVSLLLSGTMLVLTGVAQEPPSDTARKIVNQPPPVYPALASSLNLIGTVKLVVTVAPNGSVKNLDVRGGHPVLVPAAERAIYKWKWAPAKEESKETIEIKFHPN